MFENGMNLELWTEKLRAGIPNIPSYTVSQGVQVIDISEDAYASKTQPSRLDVSEAGSGYMEIFEQL